MTRFVPKKSSSSIIDLTFKISLTTFYLQISVHYSLLKPDLYLHELDSLFLDASSRLACLHSSSSLAMRSQVFFHAGLKQFCPAYSAIDSHRARLCDGEASAENH